MNDQTILYVLLAILMAGLLVVWYRQFYFRRSFCANIKQINEKLKEILETGSDEKVMVFTDHPVLMELEGQIDRLLTDRQKIRADFRRAENTSKTMLANISHDIKTPLTVICGYLEMMRLEREDEMLEKVEAKAKQVTDLVNAFFTLAKLEAGDMEVSLCRMDISEVCRENVLDFYEILRHRAFQVDLQIPETAIYVWGDRNAFRRILHNLLSNVIRYGSDGNYLGVFLRQDKSNVYIDVVDKGKGIDPKFADNVFERLYTMEDSRNREIQGNGLGLTIAKHLAVRMGGDISLHSIPNVRTTFTLRISSP